MKPSDDKPPPIIAVWDCSRCGVRRGDPHRGDCDGKRGPKVPWPEETK